MWFWPIIVAVVLLGAYWVYLSSVWRNSYLPIFRKSQLANDNDSEDKEDGLSGVELLMMLRDAFPQLEVMHGLANIKASSVTKFVLFVIASIVTHAMEGSSIPLWVFTVFTVIAFLTWRSRSLSFRALIDEDRKLLTPFYQTFANHVFSFCEIYCTLS